MNYNFVYLSKPQLFYPYKILKILKIKGASEFPFGIFSRQASTFIFAIISRIFKVGFQFI
jgi:hypothetical protein